MTETPDDRARAELDGALAELRREIESSLERRAAADASDLGGRVFDLFEGLRRRANTFGMVERSGRVDEFGLDEVALRRTRPLLDFLRDRWWRIDVDGLDHLPLSGGCLLVANRSGLLPYDGLMLSHLVGRWHPGGVHPRFLVADWINAQPFVQPAVARLGGVRACRENADRILAGGGWVIAFPEGQKGAAKPFRERYRLQRFGRGGVVRAALANEVPLVPVAVVGAEEAHPILFKVGALARTLGLPFVPVTPTFPMLGPLGLLPLPSKWVVRFGEPIPMEGLGADAAHDELVISRVTEQLRARIQSMVDDALDQRESVWD